MEERIKEIEDILEHKDFSAQFRLAYLSIDKVYAERINYARNNNLKLRRSPLEVFCDSVSCEQAKEEFTKVLKKESKLSKSQRTIILTIGSIAIGETNKSILNDRKE